MGVWSYSFSGPALWSRICQVGPVSLPMAHCIFGFGCRRLSHIDSSSFPVHMQGANPPVWVFVGFDPGALQLPPFWQTSLLEIDLSELGVDSSQCVHHHWRSDVSGNGQRTT